MTNAPSPATLHPDPEVIVFNIKERYTGVSATVNALVPLQATQWKLGYCGNTMSNGVIGMTLRDAIKVSKKPSAGRAFRIWHVRRDHEMMAGIFVRDVLRLPIRLVFTSAAQHRHGGFPRWLISRMDAVISTTPLAASFVPNTTAVVPHGIDLARFSPPPDKLTAWTETGLPGKYGIGVFGRVRPDKGTDVFVQAMLVALRELPDATAVIAGLAQPQHKAFQQELEKTIRDADMAERIVFLGEVPAGKVHWWYQRCLLCVACPRYEPFGLTPFEAGACGCAVVCSLTGAFDMLVTPGVQGELVPTGDAPALASAVQKVMADPPATVKMGEATRERVMTQFSLAAEAAGIGRVYESLFSGASVDRS